MIPFFINSAPSHSIARSEFKESQGQPNPFTLFESMSLKALALANRGQLGGEISMAKKLPGRMTASYGFYGKGNESLKLFMLVKVPDILDILLYLIIYPELFHLKGHRFYIEICVLIWSSEQIAKSSPKKRRYLRKSIGGQYRNSGSPDGRKFWGDGGLVVAKKYPLNAKGSRVFSTKSSIPTGLDELGNLRRRNVEDKLQP